MEEAYRLLVASTRESLGGYTVETVANAIVTLAVNELLRAGVTRYEVGTWLEKHAGRLLDQATHERRRRRR